jgi:hypothetical protein
VGHCGCESEVRSTRRTRDERVKHVYARLTRLDVVVGPRAPVGPGGYRMWAGYRVWAGGPKWLLSNLALAAAASVGVLCRKWLSN